MERLQLIQALNALLLDDLPQVRADAAAFGPDAASQRRLLRSLMNLRPPMPLRPDYLALQDELLSAEREEKGVVDASALPGSAADPRLKLWRGDITRLAADAIVNAANSGLTGCYCPCHGCVDNAIHSAAGLQLRDACARIVRRQGPPAPARPAPGPPRVNHPSRYVLHTVGPFVTGPLRREDCAQLAACYRACLTLAAAQGASTVAFCCISTGEFHFPPDRAADIAVRTVRAYLAETHAEIKVIFNVFKASDEALYRRLLGPN